MIRTTPTQPRTMRRARRGTVLLFALGVLAVIAVAALSYVTFVRLDRQSAAAVSRGVGFERQVNLVRDHIGDLIAADLFDNMVVTKDVPRASGNIQLWPRMFQDGEYRDYPWTDFSTFDRENQARTNYRPSDAAVLSLVRDTKGGSRFELGPRDDAWLAATEPVWSFAGGRVFQAYWPQITNLRSGYRYDDNGTPKRFDDDRWVRGDGRYVDLGQLFLDDLTSGGAPRANPGTNLLDFSLNIGTGNGVIFPEEAAGDYARAPYEQINFMDTVNPSPVFTKSDERFWADTDGDLRADARWQVLDQLGNFNGLVWVVAARITDASALVNYNAAMDGGYNAIDAGAVGTGHTPADIDLERLILTAVNDPFARYSPSLFPNNSPFTNVSLTDFDQAFTSHVIDRMKTQAVLEKLTTPAPQGLGLTGITTMFPSWTWSSANRLDQTQRDAMWNWVGSSTSTPRLDLSAQNVVTLGYSRGDFVDLCAFWGTNQRSYLSQVEETFDGPNLLPRTDDPVNIGRAIGPLMAASTSNTARYLGTAPTFSLGNEGRPSATEMKWDIRRLLTPYNGSGESSPIPVLNMDDRTPTGELRYANLFRNEKIKLSGFSSVDVPEAFEALVWALAPLATDETISPGLFGINGQYQINGGNIDTAPTYHYGGELGGPAYSLPGFLGQDAVATLAGPSFALLTSAELATNLADATDADNVPTVSRLMATQQDNASTGGIRDCSATPAIELGTAFSQGDVPSALLQRLMVGDFTTEGNALEQDCDNGTTASWELANKNNGMTIVGLERHPYITEIFSAAAYTTVAEVDGRPGATQWDGQIESPATPASQNGALLAIQIANPWDSNLSLAPFEVRMLKDNNLDPNGRPLDEMLIFRFPDNAVIPANGVQTYLFFFDALWYRAAVADPPIGVLDVNGSSETINPDKGIASAILAGAAGAVDARMYLVKYDTGGNSTVVDDSEISNDSPVFFQGLADAVDPEYFKAVLVQTGIPGLDGAAVVDKIENSNGTEKFPATLDLGLPLDASTGFSQTYFEILGYNFDIVACPSAQATLDQLTGRKINGRVLVTGTLTRPTDRAMNVGGTGFPPFVFDFGRALTNLTRGNSAALNPSQNFAGDQIYGEAWLEPINAGQGQDLLNPCDDEPAIVNPGSSPPGFLPNHLVTEPNGDIKLFVLDSNLGTGTLKPNADGGCPHAGNIADWQLFVPNKDLYAVSDLGMICTYANLCFDNQTKDLDAWQTVGEQLARSIYYDFNAQALDVSQTGAASNPYIGTLDFSRFIPQGGRFPDGQSPDESLALPLAVRVFDCFEGLKTWTDQTLVNGRINVNTAPDRVLETLPLLAPASAIPGTNLFQTLERVKLIQRYRAGLDPDFRNFLTPSDITNMTTPRLRRSDLIDAPGQFPGLDRFNPSGMATAGELAILDQWQGGDITGTDGFGAIGKDANPDSAPPTDVWQTGLIDSAADPTDDAEERLALYRAVSNLVSSRSDVFIAWFVIRGYDPDKIERIKVTTGSELDAMENEDPEFAPDYESRWLVVYDRSNVKRPTDRPRVILQAELPSAKP